MFYKHETEDKNSYTVEYHRVMFIHTHLFVCIHLYCVFLFTEFYLE